MIVSTMTFPEISHEILTDYAGVLPRVAKSLQGRMHLYRKNAMMTDKPITFRPIEFTSARNNKFIIVPKSNGKSDFRKKGLIFICLVSFRVNNYPYYAMVSLDGKNLGFYTLHLIQRYYERRFGDTEDITLDKVCKFFSENSITPIDDQDVPKYENSIFAKTENGILFGEKIDDHLNLFKTFITDDMAKGNQVKVSDGLRERLERYINEVKKNGAT